MIEEKGFEAVSIEHLLTDTARSSVGGDGQGQGTRPPSTLRPVNRLQTKRI